MRALIRGAIINGKKPPPFCRRIFFLFCQAIVGLSWTNLRSTCRCCFRRLFSDFFSWTTPFKTFRAHSHIHRTALSADLSSALRALLSQCLSVSNNEACFLENFFFAAAAAAAEFEPWIRSRFLFFFDAFAAIVGERLRLPGLVRFYLFNHNFLYLGT